MNQSEMYEQNQARNQDDERPKYIEPKIKYPSYEDFSNQGPAEPKYSQSRGYVEHR